MLDPKKRTTARQALFHEFITRYNANGPSGKLQGSKLLLNRNNQPCSSKHVYEASSEIPKKVGNASKISSLRHLMGILHIRTFRKMDLTDSNVKSPLKINPHPNSENNAPAIGENSEAIVDISEKFPLGDKRANDSKKFWKRILHRNTTPRNYLKVYPN